MTVALNANALITAAELDTFLQKTIGDSDYSNTLINFASDFIERYCNRVFNATNYTREVYDGHGENELFVKNPPINIATLTPVVEQWDTYSNALLYTYIRYTEYLIYDIEGYFHLHGKFVKGKRNYRLTYNGGFVTIPYDLKKACADLCQWMKDFKDKIGIKSERIGSYSYTTGTASNVTIGGLAVPPEILSLLSNYRFYQITIT